MCITATTENKKRTNSKVTMAGFCFSHPGMLTGVWGRAGQPETTTVPGLSAGGGEKFSSGC